MRTSADVGHATAKVQGKQQAVRLDIAKDVDRLAMTVIKVDCGEVDPLGGQCMTDAAWLGGNLGEAAAFGICRNASCKIVSMV